MRWEEKENEKLLTNSPYPVVICVTYQVTTSLSPLFLSYKVRIFFFVCALFYLQVKILVSLVSL